MTPRIALAALLLASSPAAFAQDPCPYYYFEKKPGTDPLPVMTPEDCKFLKSLEEPFAKLSAAAGLTNTKLEKAVFVEPSWNAYAMPGGWVVVNDKFVRDLRGERLAAIAVLAHEIGHVVQEQDGGGNKRDEIWKSTGAGQAWNDYNRRFESQADRIAGELLSLAGYPNDALSRFAKVLGGSDFRLSSDHTHPASGIRWLEALKQQDALSLQRHDETLAVMRKRTRALMSRPAYDRDPDTRTDGDYRSPREWAATDPVAAKYRDRKPFAAPVKVEALDAQGRVPMARSWRVNVTEPPLSAAPEAARAEAGVETLSLSDRLALRARGQGEQSSYAGAVWSGAWEWMKDETKRWVAPKPGKAEKKPVKP